MMKKTVVPRIAGLFVLYCVIFTAVVTLQFSKKGGFTHRVGAMTIMGYYAEESGGPAPEAVAGEFFLERAVTVREYGGVPFCR